MVLGTAALALAGIACAQPAPFKSVRYDQDYGWLRASLARALRLFPRQRCS